LNSFGEVANGFGILGRGKYIWMASGNVEDLRKFTKFSIFLDSYQRLGFWENFEKLQEN
jgi:hypothetical protein